MWKIIGRDREKSTFRELQNVLKHVSRFLKKKYPLSDIPFLALNYAFIENYDFYLRIRLKLQSGTILGLISRLRRMITYAINKGILSNDPFFGYKPDQRLVPFFLLFGTGLYGYMQADGE